MNEAEKYAQKVIDQLSKEAGFISAEIVDWRESFGYYEPRISLVNEYGTFKAWAQNGESINDMEWKEVI